MKRPRKKRRWLYRNRHILWNILRIVCVLVLLWSSWQLISYGLDWLNAKRGTSELRDLYYSQETETAAPAETAAMVTEAPVISDAGVTAAPVQEKEPEQEKETEQEKEIQPAVQQTTAPAPTKDQWSSSYPDNPYWTISDQIKKLQKTNQDIIGWVKIDDVLDQAVVQRDNEYYLNRDYRGHHNLNGALFLDEKCNLFYRPGLYMIYGHNMKTGEMFGCLRNWENRSYFISHCIVRLDTLYESGDYIVFATGEMSTTSLSKAMLLYSGKGNGSAQNRDRMERLISDLKLSSFFSCPIEVTADDQLLLLVTCTGDDTERRVLAARRIRKNESIREMQDQAALTGKK